MEREVPQTEEGSRNAPHNVVRLWDWIGPHDELVPFGQDAHAPEPEEAPAITFAASEAPASASDFWGERAASVHDALRAPAADWAGSDADAGAAKSAVHPAEPAARRGQPRAHLRTRRLFAWSEALRLRRPARRRRVVMAGAAAIAVAAATGVALAFTLGGSVPPGPGAAKTQVASVLTNGMDRILRLDLPVTTPRSSRTRAAASRRSVQVRRSTTRPRYVPQPVHYIPPTPTPSQPSVDATTAQAGAGNPPPERGPSSTSTTSTASVSATGQSGALGPVQSPDG